jgi:hypothetical protein
MITQTFKKPAFKGKKLYLVVVLLVFSSLSGLVLIRTIPLSIIFLLMQLVSLLVGVVHVRLLYQLFPKLHPDKVVPAALTTLSVNAGGAASMAASLHLLGSSLSLVSSALLFSLPFFVFTAFRYYLQIPPKVYKKWYYPVGSPMPDLDLLDLTKILVIQLEFPKRLADTQPTNFKAKAPVDMRFGELFFIFLNDYQEQNPNSPIQYLDDQNQPFGWVFYRKTTWWKSRKYFDPDLSFKENGATDNEVIICQRV